MYKVVVSAKQAPGFLAWCRENIDDAHYPEQAKDKAFLAGKFPRWSDKQLRWLSLIVFRITIDTGKEVPRYSEIRKGFDDEIKEKLGNSQTDTVPAERLREKSDKPKKPRKEVADKWNLLGRDLRDPRLTLADVKLWYVLLELKWDKPYIEASVTKLAKLTGLDARTVERSQKRLYEWGFFDKSGSTKGGRNQTMRYCYMMPFGRYRHGLPSPEELKVIDSGINPSTGKAFSPWIRAARHPDLQTGVTDENPGVQTGVTGAKPRSVSRSKSACHLLEGTISQKAVASAAERARQPLESLSPLRGVAPSGRDLEREREAEREDEGHFEPYADDADEPNQQDVDQQGTSPPEPEAGYQEDVSQQPAATRPVPRSTARPPAPRRRSDRDPQRWVPWMEKFHSDWDDWGGDEEEDDPRDKRFCYEVLEKEHKIDGVMLVLSIERFYTRVRDTPFPGTERALSDLGEWLRGEKNRRPRRL